MAKKRVGAVRVDLIATSGAFTRGIKRAQSSLTRFTAGVKAMAKRTAVFMKGVGIAAAGMAVGFGYAISRTLKSMDALAKNAKMLEINTKQLGRLHHASELSGVSLQAFDKAFRNFVKVVSEANLGLGVGIRAFDQLGIKMSEIHDLSPYEIFLRIADAWENVTNRVDRARVAYELFGGRGTMVKNILAEGREAIVAMGDEADKLGITFSTAGGAMVEAANDAMKKVWDVFRGGMQTLTEQVAPFLTAGSDAFVAWATSGEGSSDKIVNAFERATQGVVAFVGMIEKSVYWLERIGGAVKGWGLYALTKAPPLDFGMPAHMRGDFEGIYRRQTQEAFVGHMDRLAAKLEPKTWAADVAATFERIRAEAAAKRAAPEPVAATAQGRVAMMNDPYHIVMQEQLQEQRKTNDLLAEPETELEIP